MLSGKVLKSGSTYNDYYGFGTSRRCAIEEAERFAEDLAGADIDIDIDIIVTTTLKARTVFFDAKKEPFYRGALRCFHVPYTWRRQNDDSFQAGGENEFETCCNGKPGKDADRLEQILAEARADDAAGERRNGPLR